MDAEQKKISKFTQEIRRVRAILGQPLSEQYPRQISVHVGGYLATNRTTDQARREGQLQIRKIRRRQRGWQKPPVRLSKGEGAALA